MTAFLFYFISTFIILEICPIFWFFIDNLIFSTNLFIYIFLLVFVRSFFYSNIDIKKDFNLDIIYKFYLFMVKTPSCFLNNFANTLKQIFLYLRAFKYRCFIDTFKKVYKFYFSYYFITWRPLFKKTSYFGYFRSNRSKWLK